MPSSMERLNLTITTTSGDLQAQIDVPTGLIPITEIVPVMRSLGNQARELEIANTLQAGKTISCQKGCAACCRPMIPVSPSEAFGLVEALKDLPQDHQRRIKHNLAQSKERLQNRGLLTALQDFSDSLCQHSDDDLDSLYRAYYALRLPCIFLENEICSIYEHRPAGCREHLVTSPPRVVSGYGEKPYPGTSHSTQGQYSLESVLGRPDRRSRSAYASSPGI